MQLLGLPGSARKASTNRALLGAFAAACPTGIDLSLYEDLGTHPIFSPDYGEDVPEIISGFIERVRAADGLVIACPEYAHGIPGGLKNALDWLVSDTYVPNMPVMLVHASTRSSKSREHLQEVLKTMSLRVYPGYEFERNLIGRTPEEIATSLSVPTERQTISACLAGFADFIGRVRSESLGK